MPDNLPLFLPTKPGVSFETWGGFVFRRGGGDDVQKGGSVREWDMEKEGGREGDIDR